MISHSRKRLGEPGRFFYTLRLRRPIKAGIFPELLFPSQPLCLFNPLALRALPLYSLTETQGERVRCIPLSPLLRFYEPCFTMLRGTAGGEGDTLIRFLCCGYF